MKFKSNAIHINLWLDIGLLIILLLAFEHHATGITVHESLGISIAIILIVHILLHWKWIIGRIQNFFAPMATSQRIKFILNVLIFISFSTVLYSGLMISRSVLPWLGIKIVETPFWKWLHFTSVDLTLWLVAMHIALSWKWIFHAIKQYIIYPLKGVKQRDSTFIIGNPVVKNSKPLILKTIFRNVLYTFIIIIAACTISFTWYGLSSATFAKALGSENHTGHRGLMDAGMDRNHGAFEEEHRHRRNGGVGKFSGMHHEDDGFSLFRAFPGMMISLVKIAIVSGGVILIGKKFKKQQKKAPEAD